MNVLLDGYPEEFEGYLIRTDFRIGIQICQCFSDEEYEVTERYAIAIQLLFGNGAPEFETARKGLTWFMNSGKEVEHSAENRSGESDSEEYFDFEVDAGRLLTAFEARYKIDLEKKQLHWFKFLSMISDLGECAFSNVVNIRSTKITEDMSTERRNTLGELKRRYALKTYTEEEQDMINDFLAELRVE